MERNVTSDEFLQKYFRVFLSLSFLILVDFKQPFY